MNKPVSLPHQSIVIDWKTINSVFLDMDGTLLDKYFDDYFWEKHVPFVYAQKHNLSKDAAEKALLAKYRSVENTLQWTDLDYWTERLGLDIPQLKREINHLIHVHDHVHEFLEFVRSSGKELVLVTNAHPKTLEIKLDTTDIAGFFDRMICADHVGEAKEQPTFWNRLENMLDFDKSTTLFADDTEKVLRTARNYGLRHLVHIAKPSSMLTTGYSLEFPSIQDFSEIIPR